MSPDLDRLAALAVRFGANVQPGQVVSISCEPGKEEVVRAIAAEAYRAGAKFVDVSWFDPHLKRARVLHSDEESLGYVPPWIGQRMLDLGELRAARIGLTGPSAPGLLSDLDPVRIGKDPLPFVPEAVKVVNDQTTNWTAIPCPTLPWAQLVFPDLPADEAFAALWEQLWHVLRLDEEDPVAFWKERFGTLTSVAERLTALQLDRLHFRGPGTDLTVGLLPSSKWIAAQMTTVGGIDHAPNLPSEEIFTAPDPERTSGTATMTRPLVLGGSSITGLKVRFENGRAVEVISEEHGAVLEEYLKRDEGAARLGEVALVDGQGRIGPLGTVFYDTLLDENAASHVAFGSAYAMTAGPGDQEKINVSQIHIDVMLGSPEIDVTGVRADGTEVEILTAGVWQI
ncbi:MAG: aminopeptidase [Solirubrobacteraceae bacterium]|nr:aminopeptidase [Solirubrobacteraceae bacterium]